MDNRRWLKEKGWGLFIHYLESLQNNPETPNNQGAGGTSWEECVNQLDVERLAQDVASTGAGYLVFTLQQQTRFACAPIRCMTGSAVIGRGRPAAPGT